MGLVLDMRVDVVTYDEAVQRILTLCRGRRAAVVCAANVHMTMEAHRNSRLREIVEASELVVPDGMPLVWWLRTAGETLPDRVRMAPDLLMKLLAAAEPLHLCISLYGGDPAVNTALREWIKDNYPGLRIGTCISPPFRPLSPTEDGQHVHRVIRADTDLLLVGLGCPKQEVWMHAHRDSLACTMVGVGAAFDMLAGRTGQAPLWMQQRGLEWVYRLIHDPRRLWRQIGRASCRERV